MVSTCRHAHQPRRPMLSRPSATSVSCAPTGRRRSGRGIYPGEAGRECPSPARRWRPSPRAASWPSGNRAGHIRHLESRSVRVGLEPAGREECRRLRRRTAPVYRAEPREIRAEQCVFNSAAAGSRSEGDKRACLHWCRRLEGRGGKRPAPAVALPRDEATATVTVAVAAFRWTEIQDRQAVQQVMPQPPGDGESSDPGEVERVEHPGRPAA